MFSGQDCGFNLQNNAPVNLRGTKKSLSGRADRSEFGAIFFSSSELPSLPSVATAEQCIIFGQYNTDKWTIIFGPSSKLFPEIDTEIERISMGYCKDFFHRKKKKVNK